MSAKKTAWHPPFTGLLQEHGPSWTKVTGEVQLTTEPLRVDDVIEVWADRPHDPNDTGSTLRGMWRFILVVGLLEYKSVVWPFQHGDLSRLIAYGMLWRTTHQKRQPLPDGSRTERLAAHEVTLLLVVPSINGPLRDELDDLGLELPRSETGYHQVQGAILPLVVIDLRVVAEREDDDLLRCFAGLPQRTLEGRRWVAHHWNVQGDNMSTNATPDLYGYDEFIERHLQDLTPEQRLKGLAPEHVLSVFPDEFIESHLQDLTPEQRLKGLAPEQRLAGLTEAEQVLALPDHLLRALSEDYIATLPADVQAKVRSRRT